MLGSIHLIFNINFIVAIGINSTVVKLSTVSFIFGVNSTVAIVYRLGTVNTLFDVTSTVVAVDTSIDDTQYCTLHLRCKFYCSGSRYIGSNLINFMIFNIKSTVAIVESLYCYC